MELKSSFTRWAVDLLLLATLGIGGCHPNFAIKNTPKLQPTTPQPALVIPSCGPTDLEQYVTSFGNPNSHDLARRIFEQVSPVCHDKEFIDSLNSAYASLDQTFGFTRRLRIDYVNSNHVALKERIAALSPTEVREHAARIDAVFPKDADGNMGMFPEYVFSLVFGEHPDTYLPKVQSMLTSSDPLSMFTALIPSLTKFGEFLTYPQRVDVLQSKGFSKVKPEDFGDLLKPSASKVLRQLSDPNGLYHDLHVLNFDWFSPEALEKTTKALRDKSNKKILLYIATRNPQLNVGMVSPAVNDFYIFDEFKDYTCVVMQPPTPQAVKDITDNLYGRGFRSPVVYVQAHGKQYGYSLSTEQGGTVTKKELPIFAPSLQRILTKDGIIIYDSCSTGKGDDNIARDTALATHHRVFAPNDDSSTGMFWFNSPQDVLFGTNYKSSKHQGMQRFTPPRPGFETLSGKPETFKDLVLLTKSYYFP